MQSEKLPCECCRAIRAMSKLPASSCKGGGRSLTSELRGKLPIMRVVIWLVIKHLSFVELMSL